MYKTCGLKIRGEKKTPTTPMGENDQRRISATRHSDFSSTTKTLMAILLYGCFQK